MRPCHYIIIIINQVEEFITALIMEKLFKNYFVHYMDNVANSCSN